MIPDSLYALTHHLTDEKKKNTNHCFYLKLFQITRKRHPCKYLIRNISLAFLSLNFKGFSRNNFRVSKTLHIQKSNMILNTQFFRKALNLQYNIIFSYKFIFKYSVREPVFLWYAVQLTFKTLLHSCEGRIQCMLGSLIKAPLLTPRKMAETQMTPNTLPWLLLAHLHQSREAERPKSV